MNNSWKSLLKRERGAHYTRKERKARARKRVIYLETRAVFIRDQLFDRRGQMFINYGHVLLSLDRERERERFLFKLCKRKQK